MTTYTGLNGMAQFIAHAQEQQAIREWNLEVICISLAVVVVIATIGLLYFCMNANCEE